jgi:hypothetical protein
LLSTIPVYADSTVVTTPHNATNDEINQFYFYEVSKIVVCVLFVLRGAVIIVEVSNFPEAGKKILVGFKGVKEH